jgi:hypothetical protein
MHECCSILAAKLKARRVLMQVALIKTSSKVYMHSVHAEEQSQAA